MYLDLLHTHLCSHWQVKVFDCAGWLQCLLFGLMPLTAYVPCHIPHTWMGTGVLLAADRAPVIWAGASYSNKWPFRGPFTIKRGLVGGCSWDYSPFCSSHLLHCFFHHVFHCLLLFHLHHLLLLLHLYCLFFFHLYCLFLFHHLLL